MVLDNKENASSLGVSKLSSLHTSVKVHLPLRHGLTRITNIPIEKDNFHGERTIGVDFVLSTVVHHPRVPSAISEVEISHEVEWNPRDEMKYIIANLFELSS